MKTFWLKAVAAALVCAASNAHAHNFHAGITDISFNARTGSTELVHTYMWHDVDALLTNIYQRQFDLAQPEDQEVFRKYLEEHFWLLDAGKRKLPLKWVGMTADAQSVMVYQEVPQTPLSKAALLHDEVMTDFLSDEINTVNVNENGSVHTLTFDGRTIDLPVR
jgi:hypothetical protein